MKNKKITKAILKKREKRRLKKEFKQKYQDFVEYIKNRDDYCCQISGKSFKNKDPRSIQVSHVLSKENYPELMFDENNVLCLSFYNHKNSPLSPHLDGFAFTLWFMKKFPERYKYLKKKLEEHATKKI